MHGKEHKEHMRKLEAAHRASGGKIDGEHANDDEEQTHEEVEDAEEHKRARGGHIPHRGKKAGGAVKGEKPKHRPDRRARGGATSDMNPETSAGKMSSLPFEKIGPKPDGGGRGRDSD
jgi:hypothetical protein